MKTITHDTTPLMDIGAAAQAIIDVAKREKCTVTSDFNGVPLLATPSDNHKAVIERWDYEAHRREQIKTEIAYCEQRAALLKAQLA